MNKASLLLSAWLLAAPALAQNIHIQENSFEGRYLVRQGQLYVLLNTFSQALGAQFGQTGDGGYWGSMQEGEAPAAVPEGLVQVGQKQLKLLLESGDVYVPAEAYCQALGLSTRRDAGGGLRVTLKTGADGAAAAATAPRKTVPADPEAYFVTQYPSRYNKLGTYNNSNCGPTCMSMVALAYGVAPEGILPGDRQALILWCRQTMTLGLQNEKQGTNYHQIERAATLLGLTSHLLRKFDEIDGALLNGQLVVILGDTTRIGRGGGGHFMLIVGRRGSDYIVNDPGGFWRVPGARIPGDVLKKFFSSAIALDPTP